MVIDGQFCFHGQLLADTVKPSWCITGPIWSLDSTKLCARLLPMAVSVYPVVCVRSCHPLGTQHFCLWPNCREGPASACPLPTPLWATHVILQWQ